MNLGFHCAVQQAASAAAPSNLVLAPPPPPPVTFASNNNNNGGGGSASSGSSNGAFSSTIGDVFTYKPTTGGSIESAGSAGPATTALTTSNGEAAIFKDNIYYHILNCAHDASVRSIAS